MVKVIKGKYGNYIEGQITITFSAAIPRNDFRDELTDEEALELLEEQKQDLAGCNDGSELIANADVKIK